MQRMSGLSCRDQTSQSEINIDNPTHPRAPSKDRCAFATRSEWWIIGMMESRISPLVPFSPANQICYRPVGSNPRKCLGVFPTPWDRRPSHSPLGPVDGTIALQEGRSHCSTPSSLAYTRINPDCALAAESTCVGVKDHTVLLMVCAFPLWGENRVMYVGAEAEEDGVSVEMGCFARLALQLFALAPPRNTGALSPAPSSPSHIHTLIPPVRFARPS
ncbi:hypothetical protein B0T17DRAFT_176538 [Bombardia bombarda]|uniref:Uncharacterized protein n=1 Tax=Bombardia bombarda TaxID=252184 RepID=A0AA39X864_9PEZI|nr:hypothetical protein B0T17DRAFT_176538 [Bombardia bombarda]